MGFTEAEARTMITTAVDFSTTQLVDGNWGMVSCTRPPHRERRRSD